MLTCPHDGCQYNTRQDLPADVNLVRVLPLGTAYNIFIIYFKNLSNTTEVERSSCSKGQGWRGLWAGVCKSTGLVLCPEVPEPKKITKKEQLCPSPSK